MLQFVYGRDRLAVSAHLIDTICARAKAGTGKQILIVPEQFSHETERKLCLAGGDSISRYAEVLSFSRLAGRVFSLYGGVSEEYLDEGGRLLTMYLAVQNVLPQLKYFASAAARPEFLKQLGTGVEEFLSYNLSPQSFFEASTRVDGQFAQKLQELGLIYESYLAVCKTGRNDPVTRLLRLQELLEREDYAADKIFYVDGFSDFTGVQMRILSVLMTGAPELTVGLATDGSDTAVCASASATMKRLRKEAARQNVQWDSAAPADFDGRTREIRFWTEHLFRSGSAVFDGSQPQISLHKADSLQKECEFAAYQVRQRIRSGGRYRDIGIAVTDACYLQALRPVFARAQIPAYYSGTVDILQKPLMAAVLSALRACQRFEFEQVMEYLKSGFSPLTPDACDRVQKYARFWNLRGSQWTKDWTLHPDGYGEEWDEESKAQLLQLNLWRQAGIEPLAELRLALTGGRTVTEQVRGVAEFLERIDLRETLSQQTERLAATGDAQRAQQTGQLYEILITALEQMDLVVGESALSAEQFTDLLAMLLGCYQVGTIPASVDQVQVGLLADFRHRAMKHLLILGAEEEKLPAFSVSNGLLREDERQKLLLLGVELAPCQSERLERELGWISHAFAAAMESVCLSHCADQPSYLFEKTAALFPTVSMTGSDSFVFAADLSAAAAELARTEESADWIPPVLLQLREEYRRKKSYRFDNLEKTTVQGLYGREISLSASKLDKFAACKFAYFMQYGMKLQPWKEARFDAPIFGTFVHYVLECTVRDAKALGGFRVMEDDQVLSLARRHIEDYRNRCMTDLESRGERFRYLFERNLREVEEVVLDVARELRLSRFEPSDTELSFARDGKLPPVRIETEEGQAVLGGFVDRVDLYDSGKETYFRVIDYKTGHKDFEYSDILNGEGLQMLIYLFALRRQGKEYFGKDCQPAGVLYVPGRCDIQRLEPGESPDELEAKRRKSVRRKGLVLDDDEVLRAMEDANGKPHYLPYTEKAGVRSGDLATAEQMDLLERFLNHSLEQGLDAMLSGTVQPDPIIRGPLVSSCRYCDFEAVCHKDFCQHKNRYLAATRAERFWEEVERRERHG